MSLAAISAGALALTVLLSCISRVNPGIIAIACAWIAGSWIGGIPPRQIVAGFPSDLFVTLTGVTLLFSQAQTNGTLPAIARYAVRACRGNTGMVPVMFFLLAGAIASIGPGNIGTAALFAPAAMAAARRAQISPFLMAIMVGNGSNAGALSPIAPTGLIVNAIMDRIGLAGHAFSTWAFNFGAHAIVAFSAYLLFGGWKLFVRSNSAVAAGDAVKPFERRQWWMLGAITLLVVGVLGFRLPIGMAAFTMAGVVSLARLADDGESIRGVPWGVILMVCGMTVLVSLLEKTQGIELFAGLIARISTKGTVTAVVAFVTGVVSAYSSTSGVVLPAFLPTVPSLVERLGGADALAIANSMNIGGHLVDVSPLSTIGALCVASIPSEQDSRRLFLQLLAWGLSMTVAGALLCWLLFGR